MVSVEQLQRANSLTKELKKHGFAANFEDAYSQAVKVFDKDKKSPDAVFAEQQAVVVQQPGMISDEDLVQIEERLGMLERFKSYNQSDSQRVENEISDLREQFEKIKKSINLIEMNQISFEKQLREFKKSLSSGSTESSASNNAQQPAPSKALKNEAAEDAGFTAEDVAIENIFYCGNS